MKASIKVLTILILRNFLKFEFFFLKIKKKMDKEGEQRSYLEFFIFLVILIALLVYVFRESLSFFKMDKKVYREKKED